MNNPPPFYDPANAPPILPVAPFYGSEPIAYSALGPATRPGILTAIGIISIVLGSLGILANCSGIFQASAYKMMSRPGFGATPYGTTKSVTTSTSGGTSLSKVTWTSSGNVTVAPTTLPSTSGPTTVPAMASNPFGTVRPITTNVMLLEAILGMILAITLLVLGILVLRNHRLGRKGHLIYAWAKLCVVVLSVLATWMLYSDMFSGIGALSTAGAATPVMMIMAAFTGLIACIYPIALLITLSSQGIKSFYKNLAFGGVA